MKKLVFCALVTSLTILIVLLFCVKFDYFSDINYSETTDDSCNVVHLCIICLNDFCNRLNLYTMFKSIFIYRHNPLHLHVILDDITDKFIQVLFNTWSVSEVHVDSYKVNASSNGSLSQKNQHAIIMQLTKLLPVTIDKIVLLDHDIFFEGDVYNLWKAFERFQQNQIVGIFKQNDTSVVLVNMKSLRKKRLPGVGNYTNKMNLLFALNENERMLINTTLNNVKWNYIKDIRQQKNNSIQLGTFEAVSNVMDGVLPRLPRCGGAFAEIFMDEFIVPQCRQYPELRNYNRKILLFIRKFVYSPQKNDVTLVTHLTYVKLELFEEICKRWNGPISAAIYIAEDELDACVKFIENSKTLSKRYDIAYHFIFRLGRFYPVNVVRNTALENVFTEYVFIIDVDFLPKLNLQNDIKTYLNKMKTMKKKALVVPAFSSYNPNNVIPNNTKEWLTQWDKYAIFQFQHRIFPMGHRPTNYVKLRKAKTPYTVQWQPKYEPYVVVHRNVSKYDQRFFAYGQNKISHILTLVAQKYEFIVLPNTFIIHKFHKPFNDLNFFSTVKSYKYCLDTLIYEHTNELNRKYGTEFMFEDFLF